MMALMASTRGWERLELPCSYLGITSPSHGFKLYIGSDSFLGDLVARKCIESHVELLMGYGPK
jgi:hypothetical protein